MRRRHFLRTGIGLGSALVLPNLVHAAGNTASRRLTILHTNDWHSRIDPFPDDGGRNANRGGAVRRAELIHQIRQVEEHVLLFDSGDIFQGTPYFNFFAGELEMKLMSQMGYDAATIGNHDFDGGIENLATQLQHANFPLLSANYDFSRTAMEGKTLPHRIFERGGIRVGVFGLGIELAGLVPAELYQSTQYVDPLTTANETARHLRQRKKCDLVVCLSHLGYRYRGDKISDVALAQNSRNIDLILGGHTHTFLDEPVTVSDLNGELVTINQVGFGGLLLGRLDVSYPRGGAVRCVACNNLRV